VFAPRFSLSPVRWLHSAVDYIFGYDFFISYKHSDGRSYPKELSERLAQEGFSVFLDEHGYAPGDELVQATGRQVRKSSYLVMIARPGAVTNSDWVIREIQVSIESGNTPIVLDINRAFLTATGETDEESRRAETLRSLLQHRLRIEELIQTVNGQVYDGEPSQRVIEELKRSFAAKRQDSRRARVFGLAALLFAILSVTAGILAWQSYVARYQAEQEARRARAGELAAQSRLLRNRQSQLAVLLATEAVRTSSLFNEDDVIAVDQALIESVTGITGQGLSGHTASVLTMAFSSDNKWLATGSADHTARLWNLEQPNLGSAIVLQHQDELNVSFIGFSPDNRWLVTAGELGKPILWQLSNTGSPVQRTLSIAGAESELRSFVFSDDGRWLAAVSDADKAWLWDLSQVEPTYSPKQIGDGLYSIRNLTFSAGGRWLAGFGLTTNDIWVWDFSKAGAISSPLVLRGHSAPVSHAKLSARQNLLASADDDGNIILWDLEKGHISKRLLAPDRTKPKAAWDLDFSHSGTWLAVAIGTARPGKEKAGSNAVLLWRISSEVSDKPVYIPHDSQLRSISFDPTDHWLYVEGNNGPVRLWNLTNGNPTAPLILNGHARGVVQHSFSPDGRYLATGDNDGAANLWALSCAKTTITPLPLTGHEGGINDISISADARWVATASADSTVRLWDLSLPIAGDSLALMGNCTSEITSVATSKNERWLAGGTSDGRVTLYDLTAPEPVRTLMVLREGSGENKVEKLLFSAENRWLAATTNDGELNIWDLTASSIPQTRRAFHGHEKRGQLISFALSADGRNLASADFDGHAWLWDLTASDPSITRKELRGQVRKIQDVWISPDDQWLVGGAYDELWVWSLAHPNTEFNGRQLTTHASVLRYVIFSSDSRWMTSIDNDGLARMWQLTAGGIELRSEFKVGTVYPSYISFQPNNQGLVSSGTDDHQPRLWTINEDGKSVTYRIPSGTIAANDKATVSEGNNWLACISMDTLQLWWLSSADKPSRIILTSDSITSLVFSNDEQYLTYGGGRGSVSIIKLSSRTPSPVSFVAQIGSVQTVSFGGRSRWIVSQSYDRVRLWPLRREELLALAQIRTGRNLQPSEWSAYFPGEPYRKTFVHIPTLSSSN
jgi:WD40 repeat protein